MLKKIDLKKQKKFTEKLSANSIFFILPVLFLLVVITGLFFYYQSRRLAEVGDDYIVTTAPSDVTQANVLGVKTSLTPTQTISIRVPIFLYHYVENVKNTNDKGRISLNIPPNILIAQIETLKSAGYSFITPNDLTDALTGKKKLSQKSVMITFDDGYMDFYTDVFPILKKEQVKGVAYIVPNFLDRPNYMFSLQLREIAKSPLVEIGAHTMNHVWLQGVAKEKVQYEIAQSRKTLQDMLHLAVNSFAYPYGAFDQQAIQLVKDAGFTNAVSTLPGIVHTQNVAYFLYRLRPGYRTGPGLINYLAQDTFKPW
jgi:peptidoglycan/xylan/chitin deacetylase (PgdA/CDA1 family)